MTCGSPHAAPHQPDVFQYFRVYHTMTSIGIAPHTFEKVADHTPSFPDHNSYHMNSRFYRLVRRSKDMRQKNAMDHGFFHLACHSEKTPEAPTSKPSRTSQLRSQRFCVFPKWLGMACLWLELARAWLFVGSEWLGAVWEFVAYGSQMSRLARLLCSDILLHEQLSSYATDVAPT